MKLNALTDVMLNFENMSKTIQGSIVIISHQERILNIADRIIIVSNGVIKADGAKAEVLPQILSNSACQALTDKEKVN